jgi:hypothetical protein
MIFAVSRQCGIENPSDGDTHERRSNIGAVIDILVKHPSFAGGTTPSPDEPYWINIE